jgi:hypothetical protein
MNPAPPVTNILTARECLAGTVKSKEAPRRQSTERDPIVVRDLPPWL